MSFLKRIFGKSDPEKDKILSAELDKINSGEINKIYPILKPGDWVGMKYGSMFTPFIGSDEQPDVVIGYGYDTPTNFVFLDQTDLKEKGIDAIVAEANSNLQNYPVQMVEAFPGKFLIVSGSDFCSEKILDKNFMLDLHKKLNSDTILVAVPNRGNLFAISDRKDPDLLFDIVNLRNKTINDNLTAPIFKDFLAFRKGEFDGVIQLDH